MLSCCGVMFGYISACCFRLFWIVLLIVIVKMLDDFGIVGIDYFALLVG